MKGPVRLTFRPSAIPRTMERYEWKGVYRWLRTCETAIFTALQRTPLDELRTHTEIGEALKKR